LGSANGDSAPLVLLIIIALSDLNENDFVAEIPGLTYSSNSTVKGYLAFCKTRCGNSGFFNWFINDIAIPLIADIRDSYELETIDEEKMQAFVSCDGDVGNRLIEKHI